MRNFIAPKNLIRLGLVGLFVPSVGLASVIRQSTGESWHPTRDHISEDGQTIVGPSWLEREAIGFFSSTDACENADLRNAAFVWPTVANQIEQGIRGLGILPMSSTTNIVGSHLDVAVGLPAGAFVSFACVDPFPIDGVNVNNRSMVRINAPLTTTLTLFAGQELFNGSGSMTITANLRQEVSQPVGQPVPVERTCLRNFGVVIDVDGMSDWVASVVASQVERNLSELNLCN